MQVYEHMLRMPPSAAAVMVSIVTIVALANVMVSVVVKPLCMVVLVHTQFVPIVHIRPESAAPASLPPSGGESMKLGQVAASAELLHVSVCVNVGGQLPPPLLDPPLELLLLAPLELLAVPELLPELLTPLLEPLLLLAPLLLDPDDDPLPLLFEQATTDVPPAAAATPPNKSSAPRPILDDFIFDTSHGESTTKNLQGGIPPRPTGTIRSLPHWVRANVLTRSSPEGVTRAHPAAELARRYTRDRWPRTRRRPGSSPRTR
jgi:hypothetical protein